jgi:hypothetical protein
VVSGLHEEILYDSGEAKKLIFENNFHKYINILSHFFIIFVCVSEFFRTNMLVSLLCIKNLCSRVILKFFLNILKLKIQNMHRFFLI